MKKSFIYEFDPWNLDPVTTWEIYDTDKFVKVSECSQTAVTYRKALDANNNSTCPKISDTPLLTVENVTYSGSNRRNLEHTDEFKKTA